MVAAVSVLALTGCNSGHDVKSRSKQANEPVVYATALTSPDGKRIAVVTHNRSAIEVGPASGGHRRTIYRSAPLGITADFYWASPYLIVFDTDLSVSTIDVRTRHVRQIRGLLVDPRFRGRGIGRALLEAAIEQAEVDGVRKLTLRVLSHNAPARSLYTACGFQVEGVSRGLFFLDGVYVDDVLLALDLTG